MLWAAKVLIYWALVHGFTYYLYEQVVMLQWWYQSQDDGWVELKLASHHLYLKSQEANASLNSWLETYQLEEKLQRDCAYMLLRGAPWKEKKLKQIKKDDLCEKMAAKILRGKKFVVNPKLAPQIQVYFATNRF